MHFYPWFLYQFFSFMLIYIRHFEQFTLFCLNETIINFTLEELHFAENHSDI